MTDAIALTPASLDLFRSFCEDAPNWSGSPLVTVTASEKGNLTDLKSKGLLDTFLEDDGCSFVVFTDKGREFATTLGFDPQNLTF